MLCTCDSHWPINFDKWDLVKPRRCGLTKDIGVILEKKKTKDIQMSSNYKMRRQFSTPPMALTKLITQMSWNLACRPLWAKLEDSSRRFLISVLEAKKWGVFKFWGRGAKNMKIPIFLASRALIKNCLDESTNLAQWDIHAKFQHIWMISLVRAMGRVKSRLIL